MKKKILITGAAGFIGFHLAKKLYSLNHEILGFDNFNQYYDPQLKFDREKNLNGLRIIRGDLCNYFLLKEIIDEFRPTHIVHLAAQAGVRYSIENPKSYMDSNMIGFFNILEICRQDSNIKLTYASSSSVYGNNLKVPFSEKDTTDQQASFYGITKKCNEMMANMYHKIYGISVTGLRFFTVYGEWGRPDMAYFSFTKKILENKPIELFNNGNLSRDFTYIDDIIDGTIAAINLESKCEIFNLGNSRPEKLSTFIQILEESIGKKAIIIPTHMQLGDVERTFADISYAEKKLGYKPKITLDIGLPRFVDWYKSYFNCLVHNPL